MLSFCLVFNSFWMPSSFAFPLHAPSSSSFARRAQHHLIWNRPLWMIHPQSQRWSISHTFLLVQKLTKVILTAFHVYLRLICSTLTFKRTVTSSSTTTTTTTTITPWTNETISLLQRADIVCFTNLIDVQIYLNKIDDHMGIPMNIKEEDRRKLPNRPTPTRGNATEDGSATKWW